MATKKKNKLKGKFVLAYDTLCQGNQCMIEGEGDDAKPLLFNSHAEAFKELFDSAVSMLEAQEPKDLKDLGIKKKQVAAMREVFDSGDVAAMEKFLEENPDMNYNNEWVQAADEFILERRLIFTKDGKFVVTGKKLE